MAVRSDSSAMRAERFDERTAENVATASTRVPPAVANEAIVVQSAMNSHPIEKPSGMTRLPLRTGNVWGQARAPKSSVQLTRALLLTPSAPWWTVPFSGSVSYGVS